MPDVEHPFALVRDPDEVQAAASAVETLQRAQPGVAEGWLLASATSVKAWTYLGVARVDAATGLAKVHRRRPSGLASLPVPSGGAGGIMWRSRGKKMQTFDYSLKDGTIVRVDGRAASGSVPPRYGTRSLQAALASAVGAGAEMLELIRATSPVNHAEVSYAIHADGTDNWPIGPVDGAAFTVRLTWTAPST